jgi:hypothetical protein
MVQEEVKVIINKSIDELFIKDKELLIRSYNIHERTIAHRLAIYIEQYFSKTDYSIDVEYNRMRDNYGDNDVGNLMGKRLNWEDSGESSSFVYPDIIVHKRDKSYNLIEIEIKMAWKNRERHFDYKKINEYMSQLHYKFGIYIELNEKREDCILEFGPFNKKKVL